MKLTVGKLKVRNAMLNEYQRRISMLLDQREWMEGRIEVLEEELKSARDELDKLRERDGENE